MSSSNLPIVDLNSVPPQKRLAAQRKQIEATGCIFEAQPQELTRKASGDGKTFCVYYKKPHKFTGRPADPVPAYQKMEDQICHTKLPSDYDIDKIVLEKKTTTVTEQRETIHRDKPGENSGKPAAKEPPTDPSELPGILDRPYARRGARPTDPPQGAYQANNIATGYLRNPYNPPNAPKPPPVIPYNAKLNDRPLRRVERRTVRFEDKGKHIESNSNLTAE